jgi:GAF domain-containing protein
MLASSAARRGGGEDIHDQARPTMSGPAGWAALLSAAANEQAAQPERICELCVQMLGVTGAGIAMVTPAGHRGVVHSTDEVAALIEELQLTLGEGPCIDAVNGRGPVLVPDLNGSPDLATDRWPGFLTEAADAGVEAVFAFPLRIGAISIGALDLYRTSPGDLSDTELPAALLAADAAALAVLHRYSGDQAPSAWRGYAERHQFQIHQATGMVQVQLGVTTDQAFLMLRARAFADERSLSDVAADVVARRLRFSPEDDR